MRFQPKHSSSSVPGFANFSRRDFVKWAGGCGAMSSTSILSQLLSLQLTQTAAADSGAGEDYKAIVCLFLFGGIDSFNVLTPYDQSEYDNYASVRSNLALDRGTLLEIDSGQESRPLGVHPALPQLKSLYDSGAAAFVANVGALVRPTDQSNYESVQKPLGLFSHSDLQQHWQTSIPQSRSAATGWAGRMADLLLSTYPGNPNISMNMSLGRLNLFQTGSDVVPYVINSNGATPVSGLGNNNPSDRVYTRIMNELYPSAADSELGGLYSDLLQRTVAINKRVSIDAALEFNDATSGDSSTTFPDSGLGDQLKMVSRAIAGRNTLGQNRQIFFVSAGGWDHHDEVTNNMANMLPGIDAALKAFYDETVALGVADCVTTFTASDFARTLSSNGNGSDHAWGGNMIVIGGAVNGATTYGTYPLDLSLNNDLDLGRGRLIPTTSVDLLNAELALWFGVSESQLVDILPNVHYFNRLGTGGAPLGFLV
ncbi:MAG: DUF1501 domain-containing protein [Planctomycetota bacterium]